MAASDGGARLATLPKGANQHASMEAPSRDEAAALLKYQAYRRQHARTVRPKQNGWSDSIGRGVMRFWTTEEPMGLAQ